jgi:hypothetical protein
MLLPILAVAVVAAVMQPTEVVVLVVVVRCKAASQF